MNTKFLEDGFLIVKDVFFDQFKEGTEYRQDKQNGGAV